jgi:hypothetical protein
MRSILTLFCVAAALLASVTLSWAVQDPREAGGAKEKDLSGTWDGDAARERDWGVVKLKATADGYIGTYSDTFNRQPGSLTFKRTGDRRYKGLWWESSLKRYGSFELAASTDGRTITFGWKALDDGNLGGRSGRSAWKRKGE